MSYSAEENFTREKTNYEPPLRMNEQIFYEKYVEGAGGDESDEKLQKYKDDLRKKRQKNKTMFDMQEFAGLHDELKLERDTKKLAKLRERDGEKYKTQRAEVFETMMANHAELSDWFDGAYVVETLEYDDRVNHTDFVLEWEGEDEDDEATRLAIDVTVAENPDNLRKKAEFIKKELDFNKLTSIDYFKSEIDDEQKILRKIPRVVIALKQDSLEDLCEVALSDKNGKNLSTDHTQLVILREAMEQLKEQMNYIKSKGLKNFDIVENVFKKLSAIYNDKKNSLEDKTNKRADREFSNMKEELDSSIFAYSV